MLLLSRVCLLPTFVLEAYPRRASLTLDSMSAQRHPAVYLLLFRVVHCVVAHRCFLFQFDEVASERTACSRGALCAAGTAGTAELSKLQGIQVTAFILHRAHRNKRPYRNNTAVNVPPPSVLSHSHCACSTI